MWLTHFSPLKVERSRNIGLMTKILCLIIIHFNIWKMIGQGRSLFEHSLHLKRESSWVHVSNSEKNMKTKTKGAHLWALCGGWAKTPFPPQRIGSIRHLASCRHLRYIECFLTPITHHWRSYGSTHSTKGALLHPQWKSSVLSFIGRWNLYQLASSMALHL